MKTKITSGSVERMHNIVSSRKTGVQALSTRKALACLSAGSQLRPPALRRSARTSSWPAEPTLHEQSAVTASTPARPPRSEKIEPSRSETGSTKERSW